MFYAALSIVALEKEERLLGGENERLCYFFFSFFLYARLSPLRGRKQTRTQLFSLSRVLVSNTGVTRCRKKTGGKKKSPPKSCGDFFPVFFLWLSNVLNHLTCFLTYGILLKRTLRNPRCRRFPPSFFRTFLQERRNVNNGMRVVGCSR